MGTGLSALGVVLRQWTRRFGGFLVGWMLLVACSQMLGFASQRVPGALHPIRMAPTPLDAALILLPFWCVVWWLMVRDEAL